MKITTPLILWVAIVGLTASGVLQAAVLQRISLDRTGNTTRVIFQFDRAPSVNHFVLGSPPRAVIDMSGTRDKWHGHGLSGADIRDVRLGPHKNGVLRAVLDLKHDAYWAGIRKTSRNTIVARIKNRGRPSEVAKTKTQSRDKARHAPSVRHSKTHHSRVAKATYHVAPRREPAVVVIDPGHGGHDPGATGLHGLHEKRIVLSIGRLVAKKLNHRPNIKAVLTRKTDRYLTLPARRRVAQRHHANLFVSVHANSYPKNRAVDGGSCYVLSKHGASDAKARQLAHFENSSNPQVAGVKFSASNQTLNAVLTDLFQNDSINAADNLAKAIIAQFAQIEPLYHGKPLRANFSVLRDPMIPSVLCETAFLSNPHQERELRHSKFRNELANAIAQGVVNYFHRYPPMQKSAQGARVYMVKAGDSLSGVAATHGTTVKHLTRINHLKNKTLSVGQRLLLSAPTSGGAQHVASAARLVAYTVQPGDTLSGIADRRRVSVKKLLRLNHLADAKLKRGQKLRVPAKPRAERIVVDAGDTLSQIAQHNDTSVEQLKRYNNLDSNQLAKGQVLWLPRTATQSS